MKKARRTARQTALLLAINAKLYENERNRQVTRYRFAYDTLRRISNRTALRESFFEKLEEELEDLNWLLIRLGEQFAIIALDKADSWVKLSSKRLGADPDNNFLAMSDDELEEAHDKFYPVADDSETADD
ncbi:hypothetical protein SAMN05216345_107354 [Cupriavidus sp. YR651]|uniref:hypothetical protein n=1 Tax=Cupriavidus sp. YR651 TaxID=1855315 RepID=UPI000885E970|nr:hypothetical protein [Cupriavidus sp. YR651]SDD30303.1 hypothetical protein SAMN05216345_107354 [Cupriavidus sp. YR651]